MTVGRPLAFAPRRALCSSKTLGTPAGEDIAEISYFFPPRGVDPAGRRPPRRQQVGTSLLTRSGLKAQAWGRDERTRRHSGECRLTGVPHGPSERHGTHRPRLTETEAAHLRPGPLLLARRWSGASQRSLREWSPPCSGSSSMISLSRLRRARCELRLSHNVSRTATGALARATRALKETSPPMVSEPFRTWRDPTQRNTAREEEDHDLDGPLVRHARQVGLELAVREADALAHHRAAQRVLGAERLHRLCP